MMAWKISPICVVVILSFKVKLFTSTSDPSRWLDPTHPDYEGKGSMPDTNEVNSLFGKTFSRYHILRNR